MRHVFIGWDARESAAAATLKFNIEELNDNVEVHFLKHRELRKEGFFNREWKIAVDGQLIDAATDAPMSTEFSFTRFLVPEICHRKGISGSALFMDCDMLTMAPLEDIFQLAEKNPDQALFCVKHNHQPVDEIKMDGVRQTVYHRKNWSSFMLFNLDHPDTRKLGIDAVNTFNGLALHGIYWTDAIGAISPVWNYLVGEQPEIAFKDVKNFHFTAKNPWQNVPDLPEQEVPFLEWHKAFSRVVEKEPSYLL